jgi:hypothetical protein
VREAEREIDSKLSLVEYMSKEGLELVNGKMSCPFHADSDPSFHVKAETNQFKCFGACQRKGRYISFYIAWQEFKYGRKLTYEKAIGEILHREFKAEVQSIQENELEIKTVRPFYKPQITLDISSLLAESKRVKTLEEAVRFIVYMHGGSGLFDEEDSDKWELSLEELEESS